MDITEPDWNKLAEIEQKEAEIRALKNLLEQTDYQMIKALESILSANSITEFISVLKETFSQFALVINDRKNWREKINAIELELATSDDKNMGGVQ